MELAVVDQNSPPIGTLSVPIDLFSTNKSSDSNKDNSIGTNRSISSISNSNDISISLINWYREEISNSKQQDSIPRWRKFGNKRNS